MINAEIRKSIAGASLKHWQVADAAGISEATLCVWLRKPLKGERLERIREAIRTLTEEKQEGSK